MTAKETLQKVANNRNAEIAKRNAELDDIKARLEALEKLNETTKDEEELKAVGEELDELKAKKAELEAEIAGKQAELEEVNAQIAELDKPADEQPKRKKLNFMNKESRGLNMNIEERTAKAQEFVKNEKMVLVTQEVRSTLVSGGKVATPTGVDGIVDQFNEVSSIVDLVKVENCEGMGANKIAYEKTSADASEQTEGSAGTASDPTFDFVTIQPTSYMVLSYLSNQVKKQSPLNYQEKVEGSAKTGLRKKAATVITNAIKASTLNDTVEATVASSKGVVDATTLRKLVLAYGGNENVEGNAWLFLNKTDLIAFGDVRGTSEKKAVYEIIPNAANPNTGVIKDGGTAVNYCINSNCSALAGTSQPAASGADLVTMFYGNPQNCELDLFGDYEIKVSEDYKFAENMLAVRGTVDAGAAVIKQGGFVALVLKKATA